jgi:hypothetical protein
MTEKCVEARVILIPRFALPVHGRRSTVEGTDAIHLHKFFARFLIWHWLYMDVCRPSTVTPTRP